MGSGLCFSCFILGLGLALATTALADPAQLDVVGVGKIARSDTEVTYPFQAYVFFGQPAVVGASRD